MTNNFLKLSNFHLWVRSFRLGLLLGISNDQLPNSSSDLRTILSQVSAKQLNYPFKRVEYLRSLIIWELKVLLKTQDEPAKQSGREVSKGGYHVQNLAATFNQVFFRLDFAEISLLTFVFLRLFVPSVKLWNYFSYILRRFTQNDCLQEATNLQ